MLPYIEGFESVKMTFQQDNAPPHRAKSTEKWMADNSISILHWPPCSPDLSPIENLWGYVSQKVYKNGK